MSRLTIKTISFVRDSQQMSPVSCVTFIVGCLGVVQLGGLFSVIPWLRLLSLECPLSAYQIVK